MTQKIITMGIISSAINLIGTFATNRANKKMTRETNKQQMQLADLEYERNSPLNQMNRFKQAGLNPNLIYGQVSDGLYSAPNLQTSQSVAPQTDFSDTELLQAYQDFKLKNVQIQNEKEVGRGLSLDNARKAMENSWLESDHQQNVLTAIENYKKLVEENKLIPLQHSKLENEVKVMLDNLGLSRDRLELDKKRLAYDKWIQTLVDNIIRHFTGSSVTSQATADFVLDAVKNSWTKFVDWFNDANNPKPAQNTGGSGGW